MTRKHFIELAKLLGESRGSFIGEGEWRNHCAEIARLCKQANPNFDRGRFMTACEACANAVAFAAIVKGRAA